MPPEDQEYEAGDNNRWTAEDELGFQQLSKTVKELEAKRNGHISRMQSAVSSLLNKDGLGRRAIEAHDVINFAIRNRQELIEALGGTL